MTAGMSTSDVLSSSGAKSRYAAEILNRVLRLGARDNHNPELCRQLAEGVHHHLGGPIMTLSSS